GGRGRVLMIFIGIDPGVGGGIAAVTEDRRVRLSTKMPETARDILDVLRETVQGDLARAMIEKVWASPQMGVSSAFTFGKSYGSLLMALVAVGIPFDSPSPQSWQKLMGCLTKGDKSVSKRRAQELFPLQKVIDATADAILLADYCRRCEIGQLVAPEPEPPGGAKIA